MRQMSKRKTLADSLDLVRDPDGFDYALANFLDRFKSHPDVEMVAKEPRSLRSILHDDGLTDAYAAATAAHLCQLHGFPFPEWVHQQSRNLREPWFAAKTHNLRMILLQESPAAFRVRDLFVSANALHRA